METRERLIELIKKQIEIEENNVRQVSETEKKIDNAAAKCLCLKYGWTRRNMPIS